MKIRDDDPVIVTVSGWGGRDEGRLTPYSWEESVIEEMGWGNDAEELTALAAARARAHFGYPPMTRRGRTSWHIYEPGELDVWVRAELDYDALARMT